MDLTRLTSCLFNFAPVFYMLKIKKNIREKIVAHAKKTAPREACGYLAGKKGLITEHYELTNAEASPDHYSFKPEEQFTALREARQKNLELLAVYHSHPASPAKISDEDIRLAYDPEKSYVIVSLKKGVSIKSFRVEKKQVVEEPIVVLA